MSGQGASFHGVVQNLKCGACALRLERQLAGLPGVGRVVVNATTHRLRIDYDAHAIGEAALIDAAQQAGFPVQSAEETRDRQEPNLLIPLAIAGFGMANVMSFSVSVWAGIDMGPATRQAMHLASALVALGVTGLAGRVFFSPALRDLRQGRVSMDLPISLAILATLAASFLAPLGLAEEGYFDAVVSLIFLLLIGRVLDQKVRRQTLGAARNLQALVVGRFARLAPDGRLSDVSAADLACGDRILVRAGQTVPVDGRLRTPGGEIDRSLITGESDAVTVAAGDLILAGSKVLGMTLEIDVTAVGAEASVGQMAQMMRVFEDRKGRAQLLADRFAATYAPMVIGGAVFGFALWYLVLDATLAEATMIAVAVLVVTCPCAAGLATPATVARATNQLLNRGILVRSGRALEAFSCASHIVFDKTGTLTRPVQPAPGDLPAQVAQAIAGLAANSAHPLSRALVGESRVETVIPAVERPGQGLLGADGSALGGAAMFGLQATGPGTASFFRSAAGDIHELPFKEALRAGTLETVRHFERAGVRLHIQSGDRDAVVQAIAGKTGIPAAKGDVTPTGKATYIDGLRQSPDVVVTMVGDGINDAPALTAADVSVSFSDGSAISQDAADFVIIGEDVSKLVPIHEVSRACRRIIRQNLAFSTVYNLLSLPLALCGLITPLAAAVLMASSSIAVMLNAQRVRA